MDNSWLANIEQLLAALDHLRMALNCLDAGGAPAHIGAHVDLAVNYLQEGLPHELVSADKIAPSVSSA